MGAQTELTFSVVIPVHNEAVMLARTAPALMAATRAHDAEIIYVLNGTTDQSADVIAQVFGENATILILEDASKTHALNAGDAHARHFPRFYLDADITLHPDALRILAEPLVKGDTDLTAAPILPISNGSWAARHVARIWGALPYTRLHAFQCCIGLSHAGRARWQDWPDMIADDLFAASCIPDDRKRLCDAVQTEMPVPGSLGAWVGVRARWIRGQREFEARWPECLPKGVGQRAALWGLLRSPRNWIGVALFAGVWGLAHVKARWAPKAGWYRDDTIRF